MKYLRLLGVLFVIVLLAGCLAPKWEKGAAPVDIIPDDAILEDIEEIDEIDDELEIIEEIIEEGEMPVKEIRVGGVISFPNLKATDPDGDIIQYTFSEPLNSIGEWRTEEGDEGEYIVSIIASDGSSTVTQQVKIIVNPSNFAPTIDVPNTLTVKEGEVFDIGGNITDRDGDIVAVSYEGWQTELPYEVTFEDAGIYTITIIASDGNKTTIQDVDIIVEHVNRPPSIERLNTTVVSAFDTVTIVPTVSDPDGDDIKISFSEPFEGDSWETSEGDEGEYEITVEASDGEYIVDTTFILIVEEFNQPPEIFDAKDITVNEGELVAIDAYATDYEGEDTDLVISGWMTTRERGTGFDDAGEYEVILTASDGVKITIETIIVTVVDTNRAPVFNPGAFS